MPRNANTTISSEWADFTKQIFGQKKPSDIQYREMRRAFYAGFASCLAVSRVLADLNMNQAVAGMKALDNEVLAFAVELMDGNA